MQFPDWLTNIARTAESENPSDIPQAIEVTLRRARRNPEFEGIVNTLVRNAIQGLVYQVRHQDNRRRKNETGEYCRPPAVRPEHSMALQEAYSMYETRIAGKVLGDLLGSELSSVSRSAWSIANGKREEAKLADWLQTQNIPAEATVRSVVPESAIRQAHQRIKRRIQSEGDAA